MKNYINIKYINHNMRNNNLYSEICNNNNCEICDNISNLGLLNHWVEFVIRCIRMPPYRLIRTNI